MDAIISKELVHGLLSLLLTLLFATLAAQDYPPQFQNPNLLQNSSFETLRDLATKQRFPTRGRIAYKVPGWEVIGGSVVFCTTAYTGDAIDGTSADCEKGAVAVPHGRALAQLEYTPNCLSPTYQGGRCSDYLGQSLPSPLRMGTVYELSTLLYLPAVVDSAVAGHIGFSAYPEHPGVEANRMLAGHEFTLDTVVFDQWYRVKWRFQPTCDLKYIALGVFSDRDGPPMYRNRGINAQFYLDDLSLRAVTGEGAPAPMFCRTLLRAEQQTFVEGSTLYFDSGQANLREEERAELDALAIRIKADPQSIYRISGHTDATGSGHLPLSDERIDSTLAYLIDQYGISPLRFLRQPKGTAEAIDVEVDGAKNRRVEISHLGNNTTALLYRHLLDVVRNKQISTAERLLRIWLAVADVRQLTLATYDPRLRPLLEVGTNLQRVEASISDAYTSVDRKNGTWLLDSLWREDQLPRTLGRYLENMAFYDRTVDTSDAFWDVHYPEMTDDVISIRNARHAAIAQKWVGSYGWPHVTVVGERASQAIPLALIHGSDADAMEEALPLLNIACRRGEADWGYYALMYDRAQLLRDLPQRYGTQFKDGARWPLENADSLGVWRDRIGLE